MTTVRDWLSTAHETPVPFDDGHTYDLDMIEYDADRAVCHFSRIKRASMSVMLDGSPVDPARVIRSERGLPVNVRVKDASQTFDVVLTLRLDDEIAFPLPSGRR